MAHAMEIGCVSRQFQSVAAWPVAVLYASSRPQSQVEVLALPRTYDAGFHALLPRTVILSKT